MKPVTWLVLVLVMLFAASCGPAGNLPYPPPQQAGQVETQSYPAPQAASPTGEEGYPAPPNTPAPISWDEAKEVILQGKVIEVIQLHSRTVYLVLADGTRLMTEEPEIDAVLAVIDECGSLCENIGTIIE
jgi:predicted small lipoprotein YifL